MSATLDHQVPQKNILIPSTKNQIMKKKSAIIPYRFTDGELEILLIKNSSNTKWVIPKGTIEKPLQPSISATKEAYEEAGVLGRPHPIEVGTYRKNGQEVPTYLLEVSVELDHYDEDTKRERAWHKRNEINESIVDNDLQKLLSLAVKVITKNGYYFKYAIKTFCNENNISLIDISKKKACVEYQYTAEDFYKVEIIRTKRTLAFSIKDKMVFEETNSVPQNFQTNALLLNAESKMGYWSLVNAESGYRFTRMYNEELRVLNCQLFSKILKSLVESCACFREEKEPKTIAVAK